MVKIPVFLAPAFAETTSQTVSRSTIRSFSSTSCNQARHRTKRKEGRDSNKQRGVSAMRSTGTRYPLSVEKHYPELPRPVDQSKHVEMEAYKTDPDHGLYGFFNKAKSTVVSSTEEAAYGRAWNENDLIFKSFDDLHTLYWMCHMEQNRVSTRISDHGRLKLGYGLQAKENRLKEVKATMKAIRRTLIRRDRAFQEAKALYQQKTPSTIETMLDEIDEKRREKRSLALDSDYSTSGPGLPMPKDE